jgi:hypothetical protein
MIKTKINTGCFVPANILHFVLVFAVAVPETAMRCPLIVVAGIRYAGSQKPAWMNQHTVFRKIRNTTLSVLIPFPGFAGP